MFVIYLCALVYFLPELQKKHFDILGNTPDGTVPKDGALDSCNICVPVQSFMSCNDIRKKKVKRSELRFVFVFCAKIPESDVQEGPE